MWKKIKKIDLTKKLCSKECFKKALEVNKVNIDALFCLGSFALEENKVQEALEYFNNLLKQKLLKNEIQLGCLYNNMGVAYIKLGKIDIGFRLINKALKFIPTCMDALHNIKQKK